MSNGRTVLDDLLGGALPVGRFGHREHLEVTVAAIERFGLSEAELVLRGAIRSAVGKAGHADKYNDTVTRYWCRAVGHAMARLDGHEDVDRIVARIPALADKAAPLVHWSAAVLSGRQARQGWVEPDQAPLPWSVATT